MVQYKTFDLKHYIVFVKKRPPTGQITFSIFWRFWPIWGHWEKGNQLIKRMLLGFLSIDLYCYPPDSIQTPSRHLLDTFQTPSRHPTDTPKCNTFWPWEVTGRKGNSLIWWLLFDCLWFIWHLYSPRYLPDTPRYDPDTVRHPQAPSRHPQT